MDVHLLAVCLVLALTAGPGTALPHHLGVNTDTVKQMTIESYPSKRDYGDKIAATIAAVPYQKAKPEAVLHYNLGVRLLQENILRAQSEAELVSPIPAVAGRLGLRELVDLVTRSGLKQTLESAGPFTLFGPTDDAFSSLPDWAKKEMDNATLLADVLKFHVVPGKLLSKRLANEMQISTLEGRKLRFNVYSTGTKTVATAQCAPIDLSRVDQAASNGVIHVLNGVMIPPAGNIVHTLSACGVFKTLMGAVQIAGLGDLLASPGPFTVFAPTDKAFGKLPPGVLEDLLNNPKELVQILTYHVVSGTYCSAGLTTGNVQTLEGQAVAVSVSAGGIFVNECKVIYADGGVTNGVVHAVDTVLLPPGHSLVTLH
ncbi:hypothetical protein EGW08_006642 [Elysia chlorotica]|uniref:FAS1 domain-containing protein n=1 Tax=Elysia chlorotica TaxID=188477 RepID=A0A433TVL2_ELYCH|nr:hypothetical protein EGW08_006642 [Elysia chlorotica]